MQAQVISDLHLSECGNAISEGFFKFMQEQAPHSKVLYILGDLFECWVGDDALTSFDRLVINTLKQYTQSGHQLYFMPGNRDFLIGKKFLQATGAKWLDDPTLITLNNQPVLLMHGDLLCIDDIRYQRYRKVIQNRFFKKLLLALPISYRQKIGTSLRKNSSSNKDKNNGTSRIVDVNDDEVIEVMNFYQTMTLIHGHTHQPAVHNIALQEKQGKRIVLGDWNHQQGWFIKVDDKISLEPFYY